jgi:hypothetical protein
VGERQPEVRDNLVAVWQQDRWSNGGSQGILTGVTFDAGRSWQRVKPPPFSRCAGGNAQNGGDYERATDPWVSFSPNGTAYQMAPSIDASTAPPELSRSGRRSSTGTRSNNKKPRRSRVAGAGWGRGDRISGAATSRLIMASASLAVG